MFCTNCTILPGDPATLPSVTYVKCSSLPIRSNATKSMENVAIRMVLAFAGTWQTRIDSPTAMRHSGWGFHPKTTRSHSVLRYSSFTVARTRFVRSFWPLSLIPSGVMGYENIRVQNELQNVRSSSTSYSSILTFVGSHPWLTEAIFWAAWVRSLRIAEAVTSCTPM